MSALNSKSRQQPNLRDLLREEKLRTLFQPIVSFERDRPRIHGLEALTRGPTGSPFESALSLFNRAEAKGELYELEQVARRLAIRRLAERFNGEKLFMNVDPNVIYDDSFVEGHTLQYIRDYGIDQDRVVFEITERNQVKDRQAFEEALRHYRDQGFKIAVDDVGSGYSNLDKIARLRPDFLKIDKSIVRDLHLKRPRFQLVETIIKFADTIGSKVIAEGIENREELQTLLSMGIDYGQGFYLARPQSGSTTLSDGVAEIHKRCLDTSHSNTDAPTLGELAQPTKTFPPDTKTKQVHRYLEEHPRQRSLVVLKNEKPVGLLMKGHLHEKLSTNTGYSLYWNRSVVRIMEKEPLIVRADVSLSEVSKRITNRSRQRLYDDVIVVDPETNRYRGNVTVRQVLQKLTDLKTRIARRANPLTGLPGNVEIQHRIQKNLDHDWPFALIYCDLDHFKAYNDYYGFERGDQAIILLKNILRDALKVYPHERNFLGHIGGDDFVVLTGAGQAEDYCQYVIQQFDERIGEVYDTEDFGEGYIEVRDRTGLIQNYDLMTVSLAVVTNEERSFSNHLEMSEVAAEVKKFAKQQRDLSNYEIDRRS